MEHKGSNGAPLMKVIELLTDLPPPEPIKTIQSTIGARITRLPETEQAGTRRSYEEGFKVLKSAQGETKANIERALATDIGQSIKFSDGRTFEVTGHKDGNVLVRGEDAVTGGTVEQRIPYEKFRGQQLQDGTSLSSVYERTFGGSLDKTSQNHAPSQNTPIKGEVEMPKRTEEIQPHREQTEKPGVEPYPTLNPAQLDAIIPSPLKRNTQLRDTGDVPRENVVHQIGDTNGSYEGFLANLRTGENPLIDGEGNWKGGDKPLVLVGDILGDRNMGGIQTYEHIARLREQGANIHTLAGNHDDFVIGHLTDGFHIGVPTASIAGYNNQGKGLLEFAQFVNPNIRDFDIPSGDTILRAMRNDPRGRTVLEEMTKMKLLEQIDDTLYVHTDPNKTMTDHFIRFGPDKINAVFQKNLHDRLIDNKEPRYLDRDFYRLRSDFLSTENGRRFHERTGDNIIHMEEKDGILLRSLGINRIIHGHTNYTHNAYGYQKYPPTIHIGGLEITSIDNGSFRGGFDNHKRSAYSIDMQGNHEGTQKSLQEVLKSYGYETK